MSSDRPSYHSDPPYDEDALFRRACEHVERTQKCSVVDLQLTFRIGFNTATRLIERMMENGVVKAPPDKLN